jgi:pilus assembly protein Flp/PilA
VKVSPSNLINPLPPIFRIAVHSTLGFSHQVPCGTTRSVQQREARLKRFSTFLSDESGATAIEYGLIAAGIALAIIAIINLLGGTINTNFTAINTSLK